MRVLVCGDRLWDDAEYLTKVLDGLHNGYKFSMVIHGAARGADTLAGEWADSRQIPSIAFAARWSEYGRAAGPIRNKQMLEEGQPDMVVAFHDDIQHSKGTQNMVRLAEKNGVPVFVYPSSLKQGAQEVYDSCKWTGL